jgi:DNA-binding NarL/FixJ family response regulator
LGSKRKAMRVMLVDDHEVVRNGIRALLSSYDDITVVGEAATSEAAISEAERTHPDLVVMDVRLPDGSGVEATREIRSRRPETKVVMLTSYADDQALMSSIVAGASAYVLKQIRGSDIVETIRAVRDGRNMLDPDLSAPALDRLRRGKHLLSDHRLARLSPQEERVLEEIAEGKTNREIATDLELAEKTVKNYVSSVLMKLEVGRRAEAAAYVARHSPTEP